MNDLILKNMFKYCGPTELNNCRLVCQYWEQMSVPLWLKDDYHPIRLRATRYKQDHVDRRRKLENFLDHFGFFHDYELTLKRSRSEDGQVEVIMPPFQRFRKFNITMNYYTPDDLLNRFWSGCGQWMTSLELDYNCLGADVSNLIIQDVLSCRHTPNLEHLQLGLSLTSSKLWMEPSHLSCFQGEDNKSLKSLKLKSGEIGYFDWKAFLNHFPALQELSFPVHKHGVLQQADTQIRNVLTAIRDIRREDKTKLQLKALSWCDMEINCSYCEDMSEKDLPNLAEVHQLLGELCLDSLDMLGIYLNENADEESAVRQICSMYGKTLRELRIYRKAPLIKSPFTGMKLEKLQILHVGGDVFRDLLFLQDLPNLRSLKLTKILPTNQLPLLSATVSNDAVAAAVVFPSITQFSCDALKRNWSEADINRMRDLMPNLTSLEMRLDNATFRKVCENFPNLAHLHVLGTELGDGGIVGLMMMVGDAGRVGVTIRKPNITNLQNLRSFVMHDHGYSTNACVITKHSVNHGFLELPRLETLSIRLSSRRMDTYTGGLLREKIPFAKLVIWQMSVQTRSMRWQE